MALARCGQRARMGRYHQPANQGILQREAGLWVRLKGRTLSRSRGGWAHGLDGFLSMLPKPLA